ncbi:DUF3108 domain-containing protein [Roseomonas marmotae]|nr:DUF3108 domain-containing protein [Roseomonas marmotae]
MAASLALFSALSAPAMAEPIRAVYSVRGGGMQVLRVEAIFDLDSPGRYSIRAAWRSTGLVRLFGSAAFQGLAEGRWAGLEPRPVRYAVEGQWRGEPRHTVLDYPGGQPVLRARLPQQEPEREPVPPEMTRDTIDQFAAVAQLVRTVAQTGRCDGEASIYDGVRRVEMRARTAGRDRLFPWSTAWHGEAARCAFVGQQIAGFRRSDTRAREPQEGIAWLAPPRPGDVPIPVRMEIPSRLLGSLTVYLMEVGPAAAGSSPASSAGSSAGRSATGAPSAEARGP